MWREPLGRALTRQPDGVNPTILDDPLDAQGGTSCRNCSWTSSPHWTATGPRRAGPDGGDSKDPRPPRWPARPPRRQEIMRHLSFGGVSGEDSLIAKREVVGGRAAAACSPG